MDFRAAIQLAKEAQKPLVAFNVVDISSLLGVVEAAAQRRCPVITQVSARTLGFYGAATLRALVDEAKAATGAVCFLHLDHCRDARLLQAALDSSFDGVMIDASDSQFEENVRVTSAWVNRGHDRGLVVEGELGMIMGTEDDVAPGSGDGGPGVDRCLEYAARTGVDLLGADIGTAHGIYHQPPCIRFDLLEEISPRLQAGFVVHGASGLDDVTLRRLATVGVAKINFSTDLKVVWADAVKMALGEQRSVPEPLAILQQARSAVARLAGAKLSLFYGDRG